MVKSNKTSNQINPTSIDGIDRISNLPEPLISHILSLLPTKNAVATSVLSTRWKFLWTSITTLTFNEQTITSHQKIKMKRTKFAVFINRVLLLINPLRVQKFRLYCTHKLFDPLHLKMWISVTAPTVQELVLLLDLNNGEVMELQINHFRFNKLVVFKLGGSIDFNIPAQAAICFPNMHTLHLTGIRLSIAGDSSVSFLNLTSLHLYDIMYPDEESVQKLFSSCPVLDDLDISIRRWKTDFPCLIISIPSLTRLEINVMGPLEIPLEIQIVKLCKLKFLSISGHSLKVIMKSSANISSEFHDLNKSEVPDCREWCVMMMNLLENLDSLKHLFLKRVYCSSCSCCWKSQWIEPLNVPSCLLLRVTTISLELSMLEFPDELELIRHILNNAKVLQVLKLKTYHSSSEKKLQLIEKISKFHKGSEACKVEFA